MKRIIITGATGFIGSHIVNRYVESRVKLTCLVRNEKIPEHLKRSEIEFCLGDLTDQSSITKAFKGFDFVIHNAAYAHDWGNYKTFYQINVEGTKNVLKACLENGIKNIIVTGSISSYGEENSPVIKDESNGYNSHYPYFADKIFPSAMNYYRDTKALATKISIEFARQNGLNLTIIEPVWVYGEREFTTGFYEYIKSVKNGMQLFPGSKKNKFHIIYAPDLAEAYYLAYKKKLRGINRFIIGNKKADFMDNIYRIFCEQANLKKPLLLPKWLIYPAGFLSEMIYSLIKSRNSPTLTRSRVNMFYDNIEFSIQKAERMLGFSCKHSLEEGIKKTIRWYKNNGLI